MQKMKIEFRPYDILKNKHENSCAFVCGAGTSLYFLQNEYKNIINEIYDHVVVSINSNILMHDWIGEYRDNCYWISNDSAVMHWSYWDKVKKSNITKIFRDSWLKYAEKIPKDFLMFSPRKNDKKDFYDSEGLCYTSSIPTGIDLAIQMGCNKIYLLGVDHYFMSNGKSHFWELWPKEERPVSTQFGNPINNPAPKWMQEKVFKENVLVYNKLYKWALEMGLSIFNCNKESSINVFPKISFSDIEL